MTTFASVQGPTLICADTGKTLAPGDKYCAVLCEEGEKYVRRDYAADAWRGPPAGAIAHWSGRVPASRAARKPTFNDEMLADWFYHLLDRTEPDRVNFRYVVALLLMRRKRLKFEDVIRTEAGGSALVVRDAKSGRRLEIADPHLSEADLTAVQDEVFRVLGMD